MQFLFLKLVVLKILEGAAQCNYGSPQVVACGNIKCSGNQPRRPIPIRIFLVFRYGDTAIDAIVGYVSRLITKKGTGLGAVANWLDYPGIQTAIIV